jgi:hypothetical protein
MESDPSANFWSFKKAVARGYIDTKYPRTGRATTTFDRQKRKFARSLVHALFALSMCRCHCCACSSCKCAIGLDHCGSACLHATTQCNSAAYVACLRSTHLYHSSTAHCTSYAVA